MEEVTPAAQAALSALADNPTAPVKLLFVGGVGTGKSTTLAAVREVLRGRGVAVSTRPPASGEVAPAVVVDDAHLLTGAQLRTLDDLAADPAATVVIAAEPLQQNTALRALALTVERDNPRIVLGPWSHAEVARRLAVTDSATLEVLMAATAGLPFLALPAGAAGWSVDSITRSVTDALTERLRRLDEPLRATVLMMSLAPGLGSADVAAALGCDAGAADDLVDRAYATGLLDMSLGSRFAATLHRTTALLVGAARHHGVESELLRTQTGMGTLSPELALALAEHGVRDARLAGALADRAARGVHPGDRARLLRAALSAGAEGDELELRLADALATDGDCTAAARRADTLLGSADAGVRAAAVRVAASVAAHDGNTEQAADLYDWLLSLDAEPPEVNTTAAGVIALTAAGRLGAARMLAHRHRGGPPTMAARATANLADGLLLTLDGPYPAATARLGQALGATYADDVAMPESAAALATLAALHSGDSLRARSVLSRADPDLPRHRLLRAWIGMQDGQLAVAAADAATMPTDLHRRDALWATALQCAIARRTGDAGLLQKHWFAGMDVLTEYSIDLFSLLPVGELWVTAARLRHTDRVTFAVDEAFSLLAMLGDPPSWSLPLHWAGVHAAILANSPQAMAPHAQALAVAAESSPFAAALARAGRSWLRVLARQVNLDEVAPAARGLADFGLTWDATRLAGQAALQAPDSRMSGAMLQIARDLKLSTESFRNGADDDVEAPALTAAPATPARVALSEREREVAELLLLGMPYRDIGAQLFISAKTVEHHVARIRRRLGAETRSEMLSLLRAMLAPEA